MKDPFSDKREAQIKDMKLEDLVSRYRQRLLSCASFVVNRRITEEDDEWAVALEAFCEAVSSYDAGKGDFWAFASTVVRRRLTDHLRKIYRDAAVIPVSPEAFGGEAGEEDEVDFISTEIRGAAEQESLLAGWPGQATIAGEIEAVGEELKAFGISFFDLTECSPKAAKSRSKCAIAIASLFDPPPLLEKMKKSLYFPAGEVEKRSGISRKILDKHRKYLIASALILDGDYPLLGEYLKPVRKEMKTR